MNVAGLAVAGILCGLTLGTLAAVVWRGGGFGTPDPADLAALRFTLAQALASAALSVAFAIPVARALARRRFAGRGMLITLMGAPFLLPVIVAVMGLVAVFGRGGIVNAGLAALGLPEARIYGVQGVLLAHVFFNLPLATRMILQGWQEIPGERLRLAASLGMGPGDILRRVEWPMLREVVPGAFLVIFLVCLTSFAVALTLGGGPRATTVELAIYQAVLFDFDLGRAATLSLIQFGLCGAAALAAGALAGHVRTGGGLGRVTERWDAGGIALRGQDALVLALAAAFLLLPLGAIVLRGAGALTRLPASVWTAAGNSLAVAAASAGLAMAGALCLALAAVKSRPVPARIVETAGMLPLAASALVMGTGIFVLVQPFAAPGAVALPVTALVNAALALPFAFGILLPALRRIEAEGGRLADSLGMEGAARLRWLVLPGLRAPLGFAGGIAAALSMGDLGVIALFASGTEATLPLQIYRLMGAYRTTEAAGAALLLLMLSFGLFLVIDRIGRGRHG